MSSLPAGFAELEPFVADWALPTRAQRYETRLSKPYDELVTFYDAIAPRADEAIGYLNGLDIDSLPEDAERLLHLLYSGHEPKESPDVATDRRPSAHAAGRLRRMAD